MAKKEPAKQECPPHVPRPEYRELSPGRSQIRHVCEKCGYTSGWK